jgi:hypothetical protein
MFIKRFDIIVEIHLNSQSYLNRKVNIKVCFNANLLELELFEA